MIITPNALFETGELSLAENNMGLSFTPGNGTTMNLGVSFGSNRQINGSLGYNPNNPFGNGTVTRNLGLGGTLNFGTNGINGSLSGKLSGANVLTYSAGQNMMGGLSLNDNLQNDLAKSKSLRRGEEEFQKARARQFQQREEFAQRYFTEEQYSEYVNASPERQNEMLKEAELRVNENNQKSNTNFFSRALSDAGGYISSIAGLGYFDADSFTDKEGDFQQRTCFVKGTLVSVESNTKDSFEKNGKWFKKIEEIKVGDFVLSWNEKTGVMSYNRVTHLFVRQTDMIYRARPQKLDRKNRKIRE